MSLILSGSDGLSDVDGSAATPAIRGTDANTGMFFPAADTIAFSEGGVESMRIDSAGNVLVNTTTASYSSANRGNITIGGTASAILGFQRSGVAKGYVYVDGADQFQLWNESASSMLFATNALERMRIDSAGNVGIGTSSPAYILDISGNTAGLVTTRIINLNSGASAYSYLRMGNNADSDAGILRNSSTNTAYGGAGSLNLYQGGARSIGFVTDNVERMRINAGAPILCLAGGNTSATGTGIAFPATQSASSDANTLDDYEEGTFTVTLISNGGTNPTVSTYTDRSGQYIKIGKCVYFRFHLEAGGISGGTAQARVSGLPFASGGSTWTPSSIGFNGTTGNTAPLNPMIGAGDSSVTFWRESTTTSLVSVTAVDWYVGGSYIATT
jgi:hypothetical protein